MNRLQSVIFGLVLYSLCSILPAYAEISNHQIFYRQDKRAPLTKIDIVFLGAGSNHEQPAQIGIALTVSKFIREFAKKHGYIDQLAVLGTDLSVFANTTSLTISISTLSENCAESIKIVRDVISQLRVFRVWPGRCEKARGLLITGIISGKKYPISYEKFCTCTNKRDKETSGP